MPKVSIITTTYNRPQSLQRAIESVKLQTFQDYEHIIVDDSSTDHTPNICRKYAKEDKRVKYIRRDKNFGNHTKPKNEGILASSGDYICYLDDDNVYLPTFIENNLTELEVSDADVVYSDMRMFQMKGKEEIDLGPGIARDFDRQFLLNRNYIDTNMVLHKRDAVYKVGGWDESLPRFADWNLFVRMMKAGLKFERVPIFQTKYFLSPDNSAHKHPVEQWVDPETGINMFAPTWFSPSGCNIFLSYLEDDEVGPSYYYKRERQPKVAIFTITYDRWDYTNKMHRSLVDSTEYPFDWFVWDNGSSDITPDMLHRHSGLIEWMNLSEKNVGLTKASNSLIDEILKHDYDIIIKADNDCEFLTQGWLEDFVDLWRRNHMLYIGPYPEGLVDHPGGMPRVGHSTIGDEFVEVVEHLSGICAFIDAEAYRNFRWKDQFYHGIQDLEASKAFIARGYMPMIVPRHRIRHMDGTTGQQEKYPDYFKRRKKEKTTKVERDYVEIQEDESAFSDGTVWGERVKQTVDKFETFLHGAILDIGCNDGTAMEEMTKLDSVTSVKGVDIAKEKVARAEEAGLEVKRGRVEYLPYGDKQFDVVFCSHTFEHAEDGKKAAKEIMRVSKRAIIIVPLEEATNNEGHTNPIKSVKHLKGFFKGTVVAQGVMNRMEKEGYLIIDFS